ncbi:hypothetical protein GWN42_12755, partial [candidate division KSB1 bacterium]|nr:hypothetical protein [candidate division KSB1 bacterium]
MTFKKLQERLSEEGWFVGWNLPCCQSCAWAEVEHDDLSKVLFNHSQDCEVHIDGEECPMCDGEGWNEDAEDDCEFCDGRGETHDNLDESGYDTSVSGFICNTPEQQSSSYFCFDGTKEGVENLKAILPIIKECGCDYHWNETGNS